jgi:hypothetical protein
MLSAKGYKKLKPNNPGSDFDPLICLAFGAFSPTHCVHFSTSFNGGTLARHGVDAAQRGAGAEGA